VVAVVVIVAVVLNQSNTSTSAASASESEACEEDKKEIERICKRLLDLCFDNPKPVNPLFGPKKPCGDCYWNCKHNEGNWDFEKCPIFE
jgi:hypothetical protein